MTTEYALERADASPIGSFDEVQSVIRSVFDAVEFAWTLSGPDKLKLAQERGIEFPPELVKSLETLPSLLEGHVTGSDWEISFGLGHSEPVMCVYLAPRGVTASLDASLEALEYKIGGKMVVSGEETNRLS